MDDEQQDGSDFSVVEEGNSKPASGSSSATGEVVDRVARKEALEAKKKAEAEKKAAKSKNKGAKEPVPVDEVGQSLRTGRLAAVRKKKLKRGVQIVALIIGGYLLYTAYGFLFGTYKAGITYGICKVYLENHVRFPTHLKITGLDDFGSNVRLWFTRVDPFGVHRMENIRCYYTYDEARGSSIVEKVLIERREEPQNKVDAFNDILPVVLQNLPDLSWPYPDSDKTLDNIQVESAGQPLL